MILELLSRVAHVTKVMDLAEMPVLVVRNRPDFDKLLNAMLTSGAAPRGIITPNLDKFQAHGVLVQYVP